MNKIKTLLANPKVQKTAIVGASYYAGAYGGPVASQFVVDHGPTIITWLSKIFG